MPRIRTIKPDFWQDEKLSPLEPIARLVFLGLISMADDEGRLLDSPRLIDGFLFPQTEDSATRSLETLAQLGRILRYRSDSGQRLIQVVNWQRHQYVREKSRNCLPAPGTTLTISDADSPQTLTISAADSDEKIRSMRDQVGSGKEEPGSGKEEVGNGNTNAPAGAGVREEIPKKTVERDSTSDFEAFKAAYPKRCTRINWAKAQIAWKKHKPPIEAVLVALAWQDAEYSDWQRTNIKGEYDVIEAPSVWINQHNWERVKPQKPGAPPTTSQANPKGILEGVAHLQARRRVGDGPDDWENWYEMIAAEDAEVAF